jgi:hypothetical protein
VFALRDKAEEDRVDFLPDSRLEHWKRSKQADEVLLEARVLHEVEDELPGLTSLLNVMR